MRSHKTIAALGFFWMLGAGCSLIGLGDAVDDARVEICDNDNDDDNDGDKDCNDSDCASDVFCQLEICNDDADNDGDGAEDCQDPDCTDAVFCQLEICDNNVDDNKDQLVDCTDPICGQIAPFCFCSDGLNNEVNGNEFSDCRDPVCEGVLTQAGEVCEGDCTDSNDGNSDDLIDCLDPQCAIHPHCLLGTPCVFDSDCRAIGLEDPDGNQLAETVACIGIPGYCTVTCNRDEPPFCLIASDGGQSQEICAIDFVDLDLIGIFSDACLYSCSSDEDCRIGSRCDEFDQRSTGNTVRACSPF